jgi:periplasmic protein TonB
MLTLFRHVSRAIACLAIGLAANLAAQDADGVYAKVDEPPVPVKTPPPKYPDALRREGVSGMVAVVVTIDEKGGVTAATVSKSSHTDFEAPAVEAIKAWKFKPAKVGGNAVKVRVTVPLRFAVSD